MIGSFTVKIVGIRHYSGEIGMHEYALVVRDSLNQYDKNAVKLLNQVRTTHVTCLVFDSRSHSVPTSHPTRLPRIRDLWRVALRTHSELNITLPPPTTVSTYAWAHPSEERASREAVAVHPAEPRHFGRSQGLSASPSASDTVPRPRTTIGCHSLVVCGWASDWCEWQRL